METIKHLTQVQIRSFREDGYLVVESLFSPEEVRELVDNFMQMHREVRSQAASSLRIPRRRWRHTQALPAHDAPAQGKRVGLRYLLDDRLDAVLTGLFGEEVRIEESAGGGPCGSEDAGVH